MTMKKDEVIEIIKGAEIEGLDSNASIKRFEQTLGLVLDAIAEELPEKEKANFAGLKIENKFVKGREGVSVLKGEPKKWKTEDHYEVKVSAKLK